MAANTLRKKVVQMLKLKRDELAQSSPVTFSKILMKASSLNATYKRIKAVYDSLDINKDGYVTAEYAMHLMSSCRSLDLGELQKMIDKLEIGHEVSPRDLKSVFELCDVDHDGAISLKEFLVTLSLLYLLRRRRRRLPGRARAPRSGAPGPARPRAAGVGRRVSRRVRK